MGWRATKRLVDLGTSGTTDGAVAIRVTRNAKRERFLFQDVIVELVFNFAPRQRWVGSSHVAEGSVVHDPGRCSKLPAELAYLILICKEVRGEEREVVEDCLKINIPGLQPGVKTIHPPFALMRGNYGQC